MWLHRAGVGCLVTDPDATVAKARTNWRAWRGVHRRDGMAQHWLDEWWRVLDRGVDEVAEVLTSRDPKTVELRQNSPFAGVVDAETRERVLTAFSRHWRRDHSAHEAA